MNNNYPIPREVLTEMLFDLFEYSSIPISISTAEGTASRYVKVNEAYLQLTGRRWEDMSNDRPGQERAALDGEARARRLKLLDQTGSYASEEVEIRRADGTLLQTLVSGRRYHYEGRGFDFEVIIDISSRLKSERAPEDHLVSMALTDSLTGLANRAHFDQYLASAVTQSQRHGQVLALAFLDLKGFKRINDDFGSATAGDMLRFFARRLRTSFRADDFIARVGRGEFAVVFRLGHGDTAYLASRVKDIAEEMCRPIEIGGQSFQIGAAVGVGFQAGSTLTAESLFQSADEQLYAAKASSQNISVRAGSVHP